MTKKKRTIRIMREWKYFREVLVRIDRPKEQWDVEGYVFRHR